MMIGRHGGLPYELLVKLDCYGVGRATLPAMMIGRHGGLPYELLITLDGYGVGRATLPAAMPLSKEETPCLELPCSWPHQLLAPADGAFFQENP
jgi:hypothetical protein